jgi:F420H(2)-dependent quinone reductase
MASYLDIGDKVWPVTRRLMGLHTAVYRASGGRVGHRLPGVSAPMLLLEHTGAKSGKTRTSPLVYGEDGGNLILVASKGGFPKNPAWFHNLRANPETAVQVGTEKRKVRARVANAEERPGLWKLMVGVYSGYDDYQKRTDREIPLVILEPR